MAAILKLYLDIALLRRGPEDVPASRGLLWATLAAFVALNALLTLAFRPATEHWLPQLLVSVGFTLLWYRVLLIVFGRPERYQQTVTAVLGFGCIVTPEGGTDVYQPEDGGPEIMCDRVEPDYVRVVMGAGEAEELDDVGDPSCCSVEQVLDYGDWAEVEGFVCTSRTTGLTCTIEDEEHGFTMARAGIETW